MINKSTMSDYYPIPSIEDYLLHWLMVKPLVNLTRARPIKNYVVIDTHRGFILLQ